MASIEWKSVEESFLEALLDGEGDQSVEIAASTLKAGATPVEFFEQAIAPSLAKIGGMFEELEIFLPEMVTAADIVNRVNDEVINPAVEAGAGEAAKAVGKVVLATVQGDLHDIGKSLVAMMCEGAGFEVKDLGTNVAPEGFVQAVKELRPDVVGMSALLTTTMRAMGQTIEALQEAGLRDQVKVMIGGAPVTQAFADQIGADGYASNAASAADLAKKLVA